MKGLGGEGGAGGGQGREGTGGGGWLSRFEWFEETGSSVS